MNLPPTAKPINQSATPLRSGCLNSPPAHVGMTLVELMVTIAILGIFAAFAIPLLGNITANFRTFRVAQNYASVINFARLEAIRRNQNVLVCGANMRVNGTINGCDASGVANGILAYVDTNNSGSYDTNEQVRVGQVTADSAGVPTVSVSVQTIPLDLSAVTSSNPGNLSFTPNGRFNRSNAYARFVIQDKLHPKKCRVVWVDTSGRANMCNSADLSAGGTAATLCNPKTAAFLNNSATWNQCS